MERSQEDGRQKWEEEGEGRMPRMEEVGTIRGLDGDIGKEGSRVMEDRLREGTWNDAHGTLGVESEGEVRQRTVASKRTDVPAARFLRPYRLSVGPSPPVCQMEK